MVVQGSQLIRKISSEVMRGRFGGVRETVVFLVEGYFWRMFVVGCRSSVGLSFW
jgi:hypothetical protein